MGCCAPAERWWGRLVRSPQAAGCICLQTMVVSDREGYLPCLMNEIALR
jgi:hypothetical protein